MFKESIFTKIEEKLKSIYKEAYRDSFLEQFQALMDRWEKEQWVRIDPPSEKNIYLIAYGDSIFEQGEPALETLHRFLKQEVQDTITDVHLLPMFPYTSDDGFSVVDYNEINPELGTWDHIAKMSKDYRLMYDFVANHISKSSKWFQGYLNGEDKYQGYFIPRDPGFNLENVVRPRTSPLFHEYEGKDGVKTAWTTFSEDQVDLNFRHFPVLLEATEILLSYAYKGASSIRLDAIGFIWKESGTTSMHLPEAHAIIQLWRDVLNYFKPNTQIITETNVPHQENISYFGDGTNEAHMVYQFSLPPLVLYTMTTHDATKLTSWAKTIGKVSDEATYFNFLASHDGIGMRPTEGILTEEERQRLIDKVVENGGRISYKTNTDGSQSVYEMNINYFNALINKGEDDTEELAVKKMLAAHSILLSVIGVPAIYYHSLLGSENDYEGLEASGINRRINREKLEFGEITRELEENSRRKGIFQGLRKMISIRKRQSAFSPYAPQTVVDLNANVFALKRKNEATGDEVFFIVNVDSKPVTADIGIKGQDLVTGQEVDSVVTLEPYQYLWVR
ncbi:Glucosylglycerate phosphorylase [Paenibacillus sp. CECT 9249]|uniref:alpha-amylase family glycosyl hydrolase n=1 Tax=Paenibacillus sp. CECT 9249 TaxID=2845385 RepID=UPI001E4A1015|nr:alpha-amylase family glycosyl hydrolase [Paenibacillus sp. CECT 9249]CAH0122143.1 Glucosylglycerate phosphorylase [Paenibacillus sp. CECT 9249]